MASLDLKDAYYSVKIHEKFQKFLKFKWKDQLYQYTCYPNGLGPCPRKFTKIIKAPLSLLRKEGCFISGYIDDFFLLGKNYESCEQNVYSAIEVFHKLGFVIHPEKSVIIPCQRIIFLGFIINSVDMTVTLTPEKKENLKDLITDVLHSTYNTIRKIACLIGKIVSCFPASIFGPLYYRSIENDKTKALKVSYGDFESKMSLSKMAKEDLKWCSLT